MSLSLFDIGRLSTAWRTRKNLSAEAPWVMVKAEEELGEVARALVGEYEHREGRGDLLQEVAQTIIVLASLVHITHPEADLDQVLRDELVRLGALA